MTAGSSTGDKRWIFPRTIALAGVVVALAFTIAGAVLYAHYQPRGVDLVSLQWAGSAAAAAKVMTAITTICHHPQLRCVKPPVQVDLYRTALWWDIKVLVPGYTVGLLVACGLGWPVFWTPRFRAWARAGVVATAAAAVFNVAQDILLLTGLSGGPHNNWLFRAAEALSLAKFSALLVAVVVGFIAVATTAGRAARHRWTKKRWNAAAEAVEAAAAAAAAAVGQAATALKDVAKAIAAPDAASAIACLVAAAEEVAAPSAGQPAAEEQAATAAADRLDAANKAAATAAAALQTAIGGAAVRERTVLVAAAEAVAALRAVLEEATRAVQPAAIPPPPLEGAPVGGPPAQDDRGQPGWLKRLLAPPRDVPDQGWWKKWDGPRAHWAQGYASPSSPADRSGPPDHGSEPPPGSTGICVSGGGIRSASVALGALQVLRDDKVLTNAEYLVSVSGGGYTTGGLQLALTPPRPSAEVPVPPAAPTATTRATPGNVFAPGTPEEDHLRRHSSYICDGPVQWLVALGILLRGLVTSLVVIGLTITTLGLAIGRFYRAVPIVGGGDLTSLRPLFLIPFPAAPPHPSAKPHPAALPRPPAPPFPAVPPGVLLAVAAVAALALLAYFSRAAIASGRGPVVRFLSGTAPVLTRLAALLVLTGLALPALLWASARLTWLLDFQPAQTAAVGSLSVVLSYLGLVATTCWRKRTTITKTASTIAGLPKKGPVNQVLPNSMIQMVIMWISLVVLILAALLAGSWVATSGLPDSLWALPPILALAAIAAFVDQTSFSLHPFYRRRLASAFAVRREAHGGNDVAQPYAYSEETSLSWYAKPAAGFPAVAFSATANITGQDRAAPGRQALQFILAHDYVGGPRVGWVRTAFLEELTSPALRQDLTVEAAVAISGAAFAAAMGSQTRFYELFLALSNARLGAWLPNPYFVALKSQHLDNWTIPGLPGRRRLGYFAREIFGIHPSDSRLLFCTDGGHYENLGLLELLRRRPKVIYCINASTAGSPLDDTLANAITLAREELGVEIALNKGAYDLVPGVRHLSEPTAPFTDLNKRLSKTAVTIGTVTYPEVAGLDEVRGGTLVYAQAVLTPDMPYQLLDFPQADIGFPRDSTGDQWFNADQFDAYQALGRVIAHTAAERGKAATAPTATASAAVTKPTATTARMVAMAAGRVVATARAAARAAVEDGPG
jgi:hypothetical protein